MSLFQSIILSIVQGVAEFLPISSSGHLNLFQHFFGITPSLTFDVFLNTATFCSVLFFFRNEISYFLNNIFYIFLGSLPAIIVGLFFKNQIESIFSQPNLLPIFFLITSIFVLSTKFIKNNQKRITIKTALIIGIFQAIAILPGVSRAGATIFAGLLIGLAPVESFMFSFSLFIPASLGALVLNIKDISHTTLFSSTNIIAFITTFIVGIFSLWLLQRLLINKKLWIFGIYTLVLALTHLTAQFILRHSY